MALRSILSKLLGPSAGAAEEPVAETAPLLGLRELTQPAAIETAGVEEPVPADEPESHGERPDPFQGGAAGSIEGPELAGPGLMSPGSVSAEPEAAGPSAPGYERPEMEDALHWTYDPALFGAPLPVAAFLGTQRLTTAADYRTDLDAGRGSDVPAGQQTESGQGFHIDYAVSAAAAAPVTTSGQGWDQDRDPGRDRDQKAKAHAPAEKGKPVFIIGNAPAACDLLARGLIDGAGLAGAVQGRLLPLAYQLVRTTGQFYRSGLAFAGPEAMIRQIEAPVIQRAIRRMFADLLAKQFSGADWVDNTPGLVSIQAVVLMRTIWPKARFVFVASRMMESVASRGAGEPPRPIKEHAAAWVREMQAWLDVRDRLGQACVTIDHVNVHADPAGTAAAIAALLALPSGGEAALAAELSRGGVQEPLLINELPGVEPDEMEAIKALAEPMMTTFGYGWERYFLVS